MLKALTDQHRLIESLLFATSEPLAISKICQISGLSKDEVTTIVRELADEYVEGNRGFRLREVAGGFRLYTSPESAEAVVALLELQDQKKLTQAALETLAVIAYKQPVTRSFISEIRGVNVDGVVNTLLDRGLIKEVGRDTTPGAPLLYGTTKAFLENLGLRSLDDLPSLADFEPDDDSKQQIIASLLGPKTF